MAMRKPAPRSLASWIASSPAVGLQAEWFVFVVEQIGIRAHGPAADPAPQLVDLGQTKTYRPG